LQIFGGDNQTILMGKYYPTDASPFVLFGIKSKSRYWYIGRFFSATPSQNGFFIIKPAGIGLNGSG
jgi:hypothetical protein